MRHKALQQESKRIQAIDRKLKLYSSIHKKVRPRAGDSSSISCYAEKYKSTFDNQKTFLLKDASKLDPTIKDLNLQNQSTLNSYRRQTIPHSFENNIWNNNSNSSKNELDNSLNKQNSSSSSTNISNKHPNIFISEPGDISIDDSQEGFKSKRFTVEKVKDIV